MLIAREMVVAPQEFVPVSLRDMDLPATVDTSRVLLITNDMMGMNGLVPVLSDNDCVVCCDRPVETAIEMINEQTFDVVVVDIRPDILGQQAVCQLRMARVGLPILLVSARSGIAEFERAVSLGADDILVMPTDRKTIRQRITELAGQMADSIGPRIMQVGPMQIDLAERRVRVAKYPLFLSNDEYSVLTLLVARNGAAVMKETILKELAATTGLSTAKELDNLVVRLRQKLTMAGAPDLLRTVRGLGYAVGSGEVVCHGLATVMAHAA
jgi:DNA-binding response OmpR family regulator